MKTNLSFLNESTTFQKFTIGDRICFEKDSIKEYGTILYASKHEILVEFDRRWNDFLHDGGYSAEELKIKTKSNNCYYYSKYLFDFFTIVNKGKEKKLKNHIVDPFEEEDWGYVKENLNKKETAIYNGNHFPYKKGEEVLIIRKQNSTTSIIKFESGIIHRCSNYLLIFNDHKNKIKNPEIDPFEEENWGYVQEKKSDISNRKIIFEDLIQSFGGNVKLIITMLNNLLVGEKVNYVDIGSDQETIYKNLVIREFKINYNGKIACCFTEGTWGGYGIILLDREIPEDLKKKMRFKKMEKPDADPFGEETWGYVQESINRGNTVIYKGHQYPNRVGEEVTIVRPHTSTISVIRFKNGMEHECANDFLIFSDKRKKLKNLEVDPFDEENWGYVQEKLS